MDDDSEQIDNDAQERGQAALAKSDAKALSSSGKVRLGDRIEIDPHKRLEKFDVGPVKAYHATDLRSSETLCYALVCERNLIPRHNAVEVLMAINNPALMRVLRSGVVYWPETKQERFVVVYESNDGKKLLAPGSLQAMDMRPDDVMKKVVVPMVKLLQEFKGREFFHGSIRPSNMYCKEVQGQVENIMLGDGLSLPCSYTQPVLYETISRAIADPVARGEGTSADDLYAFGVSLAVMLRTVDPMQGMSDEDIIRAKIREGSYSAITAKDRFRGSILELLRGLLHDDPEQRWTIDEVLVWLDGRRLSPKQSMKHIKAPRPLLFNNEKYFMKSFLALDIGKNSAEAMKVVESGELEQWLERALEDDEAVERVQMAVKAAREGGTGVGQEERLTANLSIALNCYFPLIYKGLRMTGEGIGNSLAEAVILKKDIKSYAELFSQNVAHFWLHSKLAAPTYVAALLSKFDNCRKFLREGKIGGGPERCVYHLNPDIYCLSEKLHDYYVLSPEDMVFAFEDMCQSGKAPRLFIDRHSAAFLSAKDARAINAYLYDLDSREEHRRIMGNLRCLGNIQRRSSLPMFPGIAAAFDKLLPQVFARFHDSVIRERLKKEVSAFVREGNLFKMAEVLDNVDTSRRDMAGFRSAMAEYVDLSRQYDYLTAKLEQKNGFENDAGQGIAALIASIIAALIILFMAFIFFTEKPPL